MSSKDNLENLVRSGSLKAEPPDRKECEGLLHSAIDRLAEYEGYLDVDETLLADLLVVTDSLLAQVQEVMADAE